MKTIIVAGILMVLPFSGTARMRLYSREKDEHRIADSLRTNDSLRVVDSIRVADSTMISRYKLADTMRKKEFQQKTDSIYSEMFVFEESKPEEVVVQDDADAVSARTIEIDPGNPLAGVVDSLEAAYNRKNDLLHDSDPYFKNMKSFALSEKKRYLRFLLVNTIKNSEQVAAYCSSLAELYNIRLVFFLTLQQSQIGNAKSFVNLHIENHRKKMEELGAFIVAQTPDVPFYPERASKGP